MITALYIGSKDSGSMRNVFWRSVYVEVWRIDTVYITPDRMHSAILTCRGKLVSPANVGAAGTENVFVIPISGTGTMELTEAELSDYYGNLLTTTKDEQPILPKSFALHQNQGLSGCLSVLENRRASAVPA